MIKSTLEQLGNSNVGTAVKHRLMGGYLAKVADVNNQVHGALLTKFFSAYGGDDNDNSTVVPAGEKFGKVLKTGCQVLAWQPRDPEANAIVFVRFPGQPAGQDCTGPIPQTCNVPALIADFANSVDLTPSSITGTSGAYTITFAGNFTLDGELMSLLLSSDDWETCTVSDFETIRTSPSRTW